MKFPEEYRYNACGYYENHRGDPFGCFSIPGHKCPLRRTLNVIAADGATTGWEHVSVSLGPESATAPRWEEMCFIKDLFWDDSECVVQFHPAKSELINFHKGCLHLWRKVGEPFPMPPKACV